MAVLVEAISVITPVRAMASVLGGDWNKFQRAITNRTLCADGELVRVAFMAPDAARSYVQWLEGFGLKHHKQGKAIDIVLADQRQGLLTGCDWAEAGQIKLNGDADRMVMACRAKGSKLTTIVYPDDWRYETSLYAHGTFVTDAEKAARLEFLRHEKGRNIFRDRTTGNEVFVAGPPPPTSH